MRCVCFVQRDVVDNISRRMYDKYSGVVKTLVIDKNNVLSPYDIKCYLLKNPKLLRYDIVECDTDVPVKTTIDDRTVIAAYISITRGLYNPVIVSDRFQLFSKATDMYTDVLGWEHPAPGISFADNRRCMLPDAFEDMLKVLRREFGNKAIESITTYDCDIVLSQAFIEEFEL